MIPGLIIRFNSCSSRLESNIACRGSAAFNKPRPKSLLFVPFQSTTMESVWFHDYCLACDRLTSGGAYCSQSCRLADLESSSAWTTPQASPSTSNFPPNSSSTTAPGFYLTPAIDWGAYRTQHTATQLSYCSNTSAIKSNTDKKTLTPSSSQSSLASAHSASSSNQTFSDRVTTQLRDYTNSFDTTRNRRRTWS